MLTIPASSSVLSGSLLIKHLSLIQAPVPPCALAGIYLSTSEPSVDLSSQSSAGLGIAMISAPQIKSETQAELRAACRRLSPQPIILPAASHSCSPKTPHSLPQVLAGSPQPHTGSPSQQKASVRGCSSSMKCLGKSTGNPEAPVVPPQPCPCSLMTPGMKAPLAQHCSLCSQPGSMNNGRTNRFVSQLAKTSKEQSWGPTVTPPTGSQPSFQLLTNIGLSFLPSLQYFWADHNIPKASMCGCTAQCVHGSAGDLCAAPLPLHHRQG